MDCILRVRRASNWFTESITCFPYPPHTNRNSGDQCIISDCNCTISRRATLTPLSELQYCLARGSRIPCRALSFSFGCQRDLFRSPESAAAISAAVQETGLTRATIFSLDFRNHHNYLRPSPAEDAFWENLILDSYPTGTTRLFIRYYPGHLPRTMNAILTNATGLTHLSIHDSVNGFNIENSFQLDAWQESGLTSDDLQALGTLVSNNSTTLKHVTIMDLRFHYSVSDPTEKIEQFIYKPFTKCYWMEHLVLTRMHQWGWVSSVAVPFRVTKKKRHFAYYTPNYNSFIPGKELYKTITIGITLAPILEAHFPRVTEISSRTIPEPDQLPLVLNARHNPPAVFALFRLLGKVPLSANDEILPEPTALRRSPVRTARYARVARTPMSSKQAERYVNFFNNHDAPKNSLPITNHAWDVSSIAYHLHTNMATITTSTQMAASVSCDTPSLEDLIQQNTLTLSRPRILRLKTAYLGSIEHHAKGALCFFEDPPQNDIPMNVFKRLYRFLIPNIIHLHYDFQENDFIPDRSKEDRFVASILRDCTPKLTCLTIGSLAFNGDLTFQTIRRASFPNLIKLVILGPSLPLTRYNSDTFPSADDGIVTNLRSAVRALPSLLCLEIHKLAIKTNCDTAQQAFRPLLNHLRRRPQIQQVFITTMKVPRRSGYSAFCPVDISALRFWRKMKRAFDINRLSWPPCMTPECCMTPTVWMRLVRTLRTDYECLHYLIVEYDISLLLRNLSIQQWLSLLISVGSCRNPGREIPVQNSSLLSYLLEHRESQRHYRILADR